MSDRETRTWLAPALLTAFLLIMVAAVAGGVALSTSSATPTDAQAPASGGGGGGSVSSPSTPSPTGPITQPSSAPGSPGTISSPPLHEGSPVPQESGIPYNVPYTVTGSASSNTLVVHTQRGGCQKVDIALVSQSSTQVVLHVSITSTATSAMQACPMFIQLVDQPVILDAPLGSRSVVDDRTNKAITVS